MHGKIINNNWKEDVMMQTERENILEEITKKVARDNGEHFTDTTRLDYIKTKLGESDYEILCETPLSVIYKKKKVDLPEKIVLISSHVDCKKHDNDDDDEGISNPDFKITKKGNYKGTFDNAATNAAVVISMLENRFSKNVVISFTGDEEESSNGAKQVIEYLEKIRKKVIAISLDVTFDLKSESDDEITTYNNSSYTIDNLCSNTLETVAKALLDCADKMDIPYMITRVDDNWGEDYFGDKNVSEYYDEKFEVKESALPDEAVEFSKFKCCIGAFSLCLPTNDKVENSYMHTDTLIKIKKKSFDEYIDAVVRIGNRMTEV